MKRLTADERLRLRLRSQRLHSRRRAAVDEVVSAVCGLQAQAGDAAALGVRVRSRGLVDADVRRALNEDRSIVRMPCMRGTLHLVPSQDVAFLLLVFGSLLVARGRRRLAQLGFDEENADRAVRVIVQTLRDEGPQTRAELATRLQRARFDFEAGGQAPYHLIRRATVLGLVVEVALKGGEEAYGFLADWISVESPPQREATLAELARRYLRAYQPAAAEDFAYWSGLPARDVRAAWISISKDLVDVQVSGRTAAMFAREEHSALPARSGLRLLPAFDTYLLGYEDRSAALADHHAGRVWPGGGVIRPVIIDDGRAVATWRIDRSRKEHGVRVEPFVDGIDARRLRAEIGDVGRFLGAALRTEIVGSG